MKVKSYINDYNNRNRKRPKSGAKCLARIRKLLDGYIKCFDVECIKYVFKECPDVFRVDLGRPEDYSHKRFFLPEDYIDNFIFFYMYYGDKCYYQRQLTVHKKRHGKTKDMLCDIDIPDFENRIIRILSDVHKDYNRYFPQLKKTRLYTYSDKIRDAIDKFHFINTYRVYPRIDVSMSFQEYYMKYAFEYIIAKRTVLKDLYKAIITEYRYRKDVFKEMIKVHSNTDIISNIKDILYENPKDQNIIDLIEHLDVSKRDL